jgi:four helix bundle protein
MAADYRAMSNEQGATRCDHIVRFSGNDRSNEGLSFGKMIFMTAPASFEKLKCWQAARELVLLVYRLSNTGPLAKDFELRNQLRRAALSVMNNIAEGFGRGSDRDFIRFLDISHASCTEVKSITYVLEDITCLSIEDIERLRDKTDQAKGLTRGLIKYLNDKSTQP